MLKRHSLYALGIFFLVCISPQSTWAKKEANLSDIIVTNTRDDLLVYFKVKDCFTEEMNKAIMNGISTKFTFVVKLYQVRPTWLDIKLADIRLTHTIQYNTLKNEFTLFLPEQDNKKVITKEFEEAKKLMADVVALTVTNLHNLKRGLEYHLRMKAELDKIELPFYLNYVFFFLSLWDFETDWYTVRFQY
jgi:hypothetical protein